MPSGTKDVIIPGMVFGRLTIIREVEPRKSRRRVLVQCRCPDKTTKELDWSSVKRDTFSCGCLQKELVTSVILGQQFNELIILAEASPRILSNGDALRRVLCKCSCGELKVIGLGRVIRGETKSCGHLLADYARSVIPDRGRKHGQDVRDKTHVNEAGRDCAKCGVWKIWELFYADSKGVGGKFSWCIDCSESDRMLRNYKITFTEYSDLLVEQEGKCALCRTTPEESGDKKRLAIDHDHACHPNTGKACRECIRGLLCMSCNHMLGYIERNAELFATSTVLEYLTRRPFTCQTN